MTLEIVHYLSVINLWVADSTTGSLMRYVTAIAISLMFGTPVSAEEETKTTTIETRVASVTSRSDAPVEIERTTIPAAQTIATSRLAVRRVTRRLVSEHTGGVPTAPAISSVSKADTLLSRKPRIISITALAQDAEVIEE